MSISSRLLPLMLAILFLKSSTIAQTQISPKYSVDADVNTLTSYGDTLIVGGNFYNVGVHTGGGALFTTTTDQPNLNFPKIIGSIKTSTPDGNGGFYVYGNFKKESENINGFSYPRIEHILPDFSFEAGFSIPTDALFGINKILYHNGLLYVGGSYVSSINGQPSGDLAILNVTNKQLQTWAPVITPTYLGGITNLYITQNTLYLMGGFTAVGGQTRRNIAAVELYTGNVKAWNFAGNFTNAHSYTDVKAYQNEIVVSGDFYIGGTPQDIQHACARVDTTTGTTVQYVFRAGGLFGNGLDYLYFAAGVTTMAINGDTLYTYSSGTFDTRVTAINLAAANAVIWGKYFNMIANATKMEVAAGSLYIGGTNFTDIYTTGFTNDNPANIERNIRGAVKLNSATGHLQTWYPDPVTGSAVHTLSITANNVFIGGTFAHVNSLERSGILMMKASTQEVLPFSIKLFGHSIRDFKIADTTLYAAGSYFYIDGADQTRSIVSFSLNSGARLPWNPGYLGTANTIAVNKQYVFIGGALNEPAGGASRTNLFAIDRQTAALAPWAPNPNGEVTALHLAQGRLYVGGGFTTIAGTGRNYLAAVDTASFAVAGWNPDPNWVVYAINSSFGTIWVGGIFYAIGGTNASHFVGIDAQSGAVTDSPVTGYRGGVYAIYPKGCQVIFGSNMRLNNTDPCNDVHIYNMYNKTLANAAGFCLDVNDLTGVAKAIAAVGNDVYFGGNFTKVNGKAKATHLERIRFPAGYFDGCREYISVKDGNWNAPDTWEAGTVPPENARVIIRHIVQVTTSVRCLTLTVDPTGNMNVNNGREVLVVR